MASLLEKALRYPRAYKTFRSLRAFESSSETFPRTDGQAYFNMRSAMDLDPRFGKWLSRRVLPELRDAGIAVSQLSMTRFADPAEIHDAVSALRKDGFYVFRKLAAPEAVEALRNFALTQPCRPRGLEHDVAAYPRENPQVGRYDFTEEIAFTCPEVREFAGDPITAAIAELYLQQNVVMDEVAFWWTTTAGVEDTNLNAQEFHQDRDRLSFLKFFVYLTDVTTDSGPHVYVRGTHVHVPRELRSDGRKGDAEVAQAGLGSAIAEVCGAAGTLMAVDTIGLHKGKTPTGGDRLALENEYSTSLFGAPYSVIPVYDPSQRAEIPGRLGRLCP